MDELVALAARRIALGSKSFAAAARLLPRTGRASMYLLYSWCRHCDDTIDDEHLGFGRSVSAGLAPHERLADLRASTAAACRGDGDGHPFQALARVAAEHRLPARYPLELLDGMEMDVVGTRYLCLDDTLRYCYHVAGVVGVMSAIVLGVRDRPTLERASDLGIAFQLTNIARDVVADAERGRIYLPANWLDEVGLDASNLLMPARRRDLHRVVARLLAAADDYYRSATVGIGELPMRSAWAVATARRVYRGIGTRILELGAASWDARIVTTRSSKLAAGAAAGLDALYLTRRFAPAACSREGLWTPRALIS